MIWQGNKSHIVLHIPLVILRILLIILTFRHKWTLQHYSTIAVSVLLLPDTIQLIINQFSSIKHILLHNRPLCWLPFPLNHGYQQLDSFIHARKISHHVYMQVLMASMHYSLPWYIYIIYFKEKCQGIDYCRKTYKWQIVRLYHIVYRV